ncbi:S16 family serine protease [Vibrio harveyi]|jgi:Lon-like ATP-dependent protease|uniref:endopeptidase La n=1 Tax=Vibrio harveyi TaxID=669 RepID=A0A8B3DHN1_VIBHA|nr:Lon protease family protein [Vibrio harveyi]EKO3815314.1 Lon protease family protein [Vibrio harveyi]EKO3848544.1 Lon protease family protein [Vibrio harveyi]MBY7701771.1 Lon protease family protein [Vibrio harveyi]PNM54393.1 Lon protease family protein [Vibrio harveyi]RIW11730.1 Lon protease family protein [Vibrio harveyi]
MNQVNWQDVTPSFEQYEEILSKATSLPIKPFIDLQPRLEATIDRFTRVRGLTRILLVNCTDNALYRGFVSEVLKNKSPAPVVTVESLDAKELFDRYSVNQDGQTTFESGLLSKADGGYLVVPANLVLANAARWPNIKAAVQGGSFAPINLTPNRIASSPFAPQDYDVKLIITGDRNQLAEIEYVDEDFSTGLTMYTEVEEDIHLSQENLSKYVGLVNWICHEYQHPALSNEAFRRLILAGMRYTEDQHYLPLGVLWHNQLLGLAGQYSNSSSIEFDDIDRAIDDKYYRESYLPQRAVDDILDGQVIIETTGEQVGQINGLTVIDMAGHPVSYGEPARISCVIHFGDGDISDVERKAELGGNLHAKGMMIMQAFVSSALNLDEPLPYSASIVFEQSYSEVDGDSASLAELCCLVSALSESPVNQQIAVTGAVDQFGRVQAVGGLNEKIEGFYQVCKHQGFTGEQGVIMPKSNLKHLALHKDVIESIKNGEFHIWSVSTVDEAIPILMSKPFRGEDDSIIGKIAERIENFERHEHPEGIVERIKNWFV